MASAEELIRTAVERVQKDVPALAKLKLVVGLQLPARGDVQAFRIELPGPKITKGVADDERLRITVDTIEHHMITYPHLVRFPDVEDAGWCAIHRALRDERTPTDAVRDIQRAAEAALQ
jgi:hypothetical protein